jgi:ABC-type bacteriocin/lantibiotic exporter with double-glycine peptidase domain
VKKLKDGTGFGFELLIMMMLISVLLNNGQAKAIPASNSIKVPYHAQELDSYCAPACVSMAVGYISGEKVSTDVLAREMKIGVNGTDLSMMHFPFDNRGFTMVFATHATLEELKESNCRGYASITSIWFDKNHEVAHFVVIVGYNVTGMFVNDPWPTDWMQPEGRTTGENTFILNSLFTDLWSVTYQWVLEVPYSAHNQFEFTVSYRDQLVAAILFLGLTTSVVLIVRRWMTHHLTRH